MRKRLLILAWFALVAAALNVPVATLFVFPLRQPDLPANTRSIGSKSEAGRWSWPTPAAKGQPAWPPPTYASVSEYFGCRRLDLRAEVGQDARVSTTYAEYGWPFPVLAEANRWWPWNDPAWKSSEMPEIAMHLKWQGLILNPLLVGGVLWLLVVGVPWAWSAVRAHRRLRRGLCTRCGYDMRGLALCPECGCPAQPRRPGVNAE